MGLGAAISSVIRQTFVWNGRATRSEYWFWSLFTFICFFVFGVSAGSSIDIQNLTTQEEKFAAALAATKSSGVMFGLILLFFLPTLAVTIRRLHDTGRSGWWYIVSAVPLVGSLVIYALALFPSQAGANSWGDCEEANQNGAKSGLHNRYGEDATFETVPLVDAAIAQQNKKMAEATVAVKKVISAPVRMSAAPVFGKR